MLPKPVLLKELYDLVDTVKVAGGDPKYVYFIGDSIYITSKKLDEVIK